MERTLSVMKETNYFLSHYYQARIPTDQIDPGRVCGIRELDPPEDEEEFDLKVESAKLESI